jgi:ubiquinone/menaquinone biosynthesis C-methylase UbiE
MEKNDCLICGSKHLIDFDAGIKHLNLLSPLKVQCCSRCSFLFLNPRPDEIERNAFFSGAVPESLRPYTSTKANYGAVTSSRKPFFEKRVQQLIKMSKKSPDQLKFLDIGASSGYMVEAALAAGLSATGIEPGIDGIAEAEKRGISLVRSTAEQLPFEDDSFDIIHSHHVFEHVAFPMKAASEAYRVLKPGGVILIEVPNQFRNIRFFRDQLLGRVSVRERNVRSIHHLSFFSMSTMASLLKKSGFNMIKVSSAYAIKPTGWRLLLGLFTMLLGRIYLGGERIIATAVK